MEEQLVIALRQAGQFVILEPQVKNVRNKKGEVKTVRVGNLERAEFLIHGTVTAYQLSQESAAAGVSADPLLGIFSADTGSITANSAERAFAVLPSTGQDRVEMDLHLIDVKTGKIINETQVQSSPQDFSASLDGLFGPELFSASGPMQTPMQKTVRAGVIRAVNWIANSCLEYRKQLALNPLSGESPKPLAKKRTKQKIAE
jgi:curli biogenesis system outer membrane secretion channel CsgG